MIGSIIMRRLNAVLEVHRARRDFPHRMGQETWIKVMRPKRTRSRNKDWDDVEAALFTPACPPRIAATWLQGRPLCALANYAAQKLELSR
ncbi:hypothetical protein PIIN_03951 [Serendipita indica DSM 11827]|uniref:Uncharacterized protein n=1 Tax=Serendipita indica (strain DSM 11827) TaxID=1109443 RepID=G4TFB0_SERID|nr:hypothetical protein PIIN_03951 [Serendipita indica DSM 11827]